MRITPIKTLAIFYLHLLACICPNVFKRFIYNRLLGHSIHKTARIGFSFVHAGKIKMEASARIGNFNIIRNLELLAMGEHSLIEKYNRASGLPLSNTMHFWDEADRLPALIIGKHTAITGKHVFDCNNTISIGDYTTIAGQNSLFYTHGINLERNRQESEKLSIGNYCMIATRCVVVKGAKLPDCSVLAANSTLHKAWEQTHTLYSGVPAQPAKQFNETCKYFHRDSGYTH